MEFEEVSVFFPCPLIWVILNGPFFPPSFAAWLYYSRQTHRNLSEFMAICSESISSCILYALKASEQLFGFHFFFPAAQLHKCIFPSFSGGYLSIFPSSHLFSGGILPSFGIFPFFGGCSLATVYNGGLDPPGAMVLMARGGPRNKVVLGPPLFRGRLPPPSLNWKGGGKTTLFLATALPLR